MTRHTLGTVYQELDACDWWVVGRQNLKDLLHAALFTMRSCSCRVSRLLVGSGQSRVGSRVSFPSYCVGVDSIGSQI